MKIKPIDHNYEEIISEISREKFNDVDLSQNIISNKDLFIQDYNRYKEKGESHNLLNLQVINTHPALTKQKVDQIYSNRFARSKELKSKYYDKIKLLSNGLCCYCGYADASTLDHYLPKSKYFLHSFNPLNLIPVCSDCNRYKGDLIPLNKSQMFFHNYFEEYNKLEALQCIIEYNYNSTYHPSVTVTIKLKNENINNLNNRISFQYTKLRLFDRYSLKLVNEFTTLFNMLTKSKSTNGFKDHLTFVYNQYLNTSKVYKALFYKELIEKYDDFEKYYNFIKDIDSQNNK